jgi:hypothetical protein
MGHNVLSALVAAARRVGALVGGLQLPGCPAFLGLYEGWSRLGYRFPHAGHDEEQESEWQATNADKTLCPIRLVPPRATILGG